MERDFLTIDDLDVRGKTVLVRADLNCPIAQGRIANDERIRAHAATVRELKERGARVAILSHQGRAGDTDFVSLEEHARLLSQHAGEVRFVDDIFGSLARERIRGLGEGEALLLENVRFFSGESLELPPAEHAAGQLVKGLAPLADLFVNDAFSAIHRSHASLVGFGELLPAAAGRVMGHELDSLAKALAEGGGPVLYVLGGVKVDESLRVIQSLMRNRRADKVLTGGLLGNLFLAARGYDLGKPSAELLKKKGIDKLLPLARELASMFGERIEAPIDLAVENQGRKEVRMKDLPIPYLISDIGSETIRQYCQALGRAGTLVLNSPLGRFEQEEFALGTRRILEAAAACPARTIVGGGHSAQAVQQLGLKEKFTHVSIGGRATLYHLAGESTPVTAMLRKAKQKFSGGTT